LRVEGLRNSFLATLDDHKYVVDEYTGYEYDESSSCDLDHKVELQLVAINAWEAKHHSTAGARPDREYRSLVRILSEVFNENFNLCFTHHKFNIAKLEGFKSFVDDIVVAGIRGELDDHWSPEKSLVDYLRPSMEEAAQSLGFSRRTATREIAKSYVEATEMAVDHLHSINGSTDCDGLVEAVTSTVHSCIPRLQLK